MDSNLAIKPIETEKARRSDPDLRKRVESLRLPEEAEMGSSRRWIVWLVLLAIAGGGGYYAYDAWFSGPKKDLPEQASAPATAGTAANPASSTDKPTTPAPASREAPSAPAPSPAAVASSGEIAHESKGYIIPAHQILVSPKVPGMITMLRIEEGQRVKKGDVLAQLETTDYSADYERAKAAVASAEQHLLELQNGNRKEEIGESLAELEEAQAAQRSFMPNGSARRNCAKAAWPPKASTTWPKRISKPSIAESSGCKKPTT